MTIPLTAVTAAIAVLDRWETVVRWNIAAEQQFGSTAAEVLGRPARKLLTDVDELAHGSVGGGHGRHAGA
ncbi:PAS domain S-box protein [Streptomyces sp. NPDC051322]|uniref:PAS domain S-box protein n=1 Tax=Streptomyces sp. NPDC051322 TaxID=3154645 RepID=UPI00344B0680